MQISCKEHHDHSLKLAHLSRFRYIGEYPEIQVRGVVCAWIRKLLSYQWRLLERTGGVPCDSMIG